MLARYLFVEAENSDVQIAPNTKNERFIEEYVKTPFEQLERATAFSGRSVSAF
jgi:hypothetical protein